MNTVKNAEVRLTTHYYTATTIQYTAAITQPRRPEGWCSVDFHSETCLLYRRFLRIVESILTQCSCGRQSAGYHIAWLALREEGL